MVRRELRRCTVNDQLDTLELQPQPVFWPGGDGDHVKHQAASQRLETNSFVIADQKRVDSKVRINEQFDLVARLGIHKAQERPSLTKAHLNNVPADQFGGVLD